MCITSQHCAYLWMTTTIAATMQTTSALLRFDVNWICLFHPRQAPKRLPIDNNWMTDSMYLSFLLVWTHESNEESINRHRECNLWAKQMSTCGLKTLSNLGLVKSHQTRWQRLECSIASQGEGVNDNNNRFSVICFFLQRFSSLLWDSRHWLGDRGVFWDCPTLVATAWTCLFLKPLEHASL